MVVPLPHHAVTAAARRVTLFGKLPAHGDFVARGLAAAEREELDRWLSGALADARGVLGDRFEAIYDQAPPWRFAARDEAGWHAGAMAPSVDGVGRRFPLLVGIGGLNAREVEAAAEAAERSIYAALGGSWDADRLVEAVGAHDGGTAGPVVAEDRWWTLGGGSGAATAFLAESLPGRRPPRLVQAMLTLSPIGQEEVA